MDFFLKGALFIEELLLFVCVCVGGVGCMVGDLVVVIWPDVMIDSFIYVFDCGSIMDTSGNGHKSYLFIF